MAREWAGALSTGDLAQQQQPLVVSSCRKLGLPGPKGMAVSRSHKVGGGLGGSQVGLHKAGRPRTLKPYPARHLPCVLPGKEDAAASHGLGTAAADHGTGNTTQGLHLAAGDGRILPALARRSLAACHLPEPPKRVPCTASHHCGPVTRALSALRYLPPNVYFTAQSPPPSLEVRPVVAFLPRKRRPGVAVAAIGVGVAAPGGDVVADWVRHRVGTKNAAQHLWVEGGGIGGLAG